MLILSILKPFLLMSKLVRIHYESASFRTDKKPCAYIIDNYSWRVPILVALARNQKIVCYTLSPIQPIIRIICFLTGVTIFSYTKQRTLGTADILKQVTADIKRGRSVCLFLDVNNPLPERLSKFYHLFEQLRKHHDTPVFPVASLYNHTFKTMPHTWGVSLMFGSQLLPNFPTYVLRTYLQELEALLYDTFISTYPSLPAQFMAIARKYPSRICIADKTRVLRYDTVNARAVDCARTLSNQLRDERHVAVIATPTAETIIVILALMVCGKVPVLIAPETAPERIGSILHECGIKSIVTHEPARTDKRISKERRLIDTASLLPDGETLSRRRWIDRLRIYAPSWYLHLTGIRITRDVNACALVLYSSGSTGLPKGVMLSHKNLTANIQATLDVAGMKNKEHILSTVDISHSFGCTTGMLLPLISGKTLIPYDHRDDITTIPSLIKERRVTALITTPRHLSIFVGQFEPGALGQITLALAGLDTLSAELSGQVFEKFKIVPFEVYGAAELSPVVSIGFPQTDQERSLYHPKRIPHRRMGKPLYGVALKIVNPETHKVLTYGSTGLLMVKGPNVMLGYVNDPARTAHAIRNGWYSTNDVAFIDRDGALHVIDTMSRFSTIEDQHISHKQIEQKIMHYYGVTDPMCIVTSVRAEKDMERMIVLYDRTVNITRLWDAIKNTEVPALCHIEKTNLYEIPQIPRLSNGKVDYIRVKELAYDLDFMHQSSYRFEEVMIESDDQVPLCLNHYKNGFKKVIIIAHGWRNAKDTFSFRMLSGMFCKEYDVICFDFRGHGKSGGLFTWTSKEDRDLRAVVAYAHRNGYAKIGVIGFSLGAAIVIIEGSKNRLINSLIAVSPPYDFWKIDYHFWEDDILHDLKIIFGPKGIGRTIRPGNPFNEKVRPIDVVSRISPTPLHLIHGDADWLIKAYHSEELFKLAKEPKKLTLLPHEGHADRIFDRSPKLFEHICVDWFKKTM